MALKTTNLEVNTIQVSLIAMAIAAHSSSIVQTVENGEMDGMTGLALLTQLRVLNDRLIAVAKELGNEKIANMKLN